MNSRTKLIKKVDELLIERFGVPKRNKELPDPVDMLIATILSQNTNDNNSYKAFSQLKGKYDNWAKVLTAKRTTVESVIRIAGLGKQKSIAIKNFLADLNKKNNTISLEYLRDYDNKEAITELTGFKGVGVKTASCVLLFAMDRNVCPVDTHVHRTTNRVGIVNEKTPDKTFNSLNKNFPPKIAHSFHTNLIRLGREICKPTKPSCGICPLVNLCVFKEKDISIKTTHKKNDFMLLDNVEQDSDKK